jgi:septum formation protein
VDEGAAKASGVSAEELVRILAVAKADAVGRFEHDAVIIGSDQCAEFRGKILGKPGTRERAIEQLMSMSGATHTLWTGVAVLDTRTGERTVDIDRHELTMRLLSREDLSSYVRRDQPLDCAGSYKIEESGIALFEEVVGRDFTAIVGLPLTVVARRLAERGVNIFDG